jgi:hypothetical protein
MLELSFSFFEDNLRLNGIVISSLPR